MKKKRTFRRYRNTGRATGLRPPVYGNRAIRREDMREASRSKAVEYATSRGFSGLTMKVFLITNALKSLIDPARFCPPDRHYGNYTKPITK